MSRIFLISQVVILSSILASSIASTSALSLDKISLEHELQSIQLAVYDNRLAQSGLEKRHGDHEEGHVGQNMIHEMTEEISATESNKVSQTNKEAAPLIDGHHLTSTLEEMHDMSDGHTHGHQHLHLPHPYDGVPAASVAGDLILTVPVLPKGAGGHSHGSHNEEPKTDLNETAILRGKGPDPLSFIEWDFAYGIGKSDDLVRLVNAYPENYTNIMGVFGNRWRTLVDEKDMEARKAMVSDIRDRIKQNHNNPGRHRTLMLLHVAGCILSCFILLPVALALRAASSKLAPLASLVYLAALGVSLLFSWLYKIMTPRLYPSHSHTGLGYAILCFSLLVFASDIFRLLGQTLQAVRHVKSGSKLQRFHAAVQALSSQRGTYHGQQQSYDPLEEEKMLSDEGSGISDAREVHLDRIKTSSRQSSSGSDSRSPPRSVHFEDDQEHVNSWRAHAPALPQERPSSPASTLCNTPGSSMCDDHESKNTQAKRLPMDVRSHYDWRQVDEAQRKTGGTKQSRSRMVMKNIVRYSHVTVARSIPVLSFAAAYTGLAVYTGSCRGAYKNVCLAHGIKGGIFFWYGLLSFGRYMGAYADMGWAWNRQPTKRNVPTAEWVECLVIFIYGATNTWMERFSAAPGDPYTVKQVQHISIAVMFWFAGLLGLVLETKSLKNLLAVPVALKSAMENSPRRHDRIMTTDELTSSTNRPHSYTFSFNPFPALVIGVTGVAMAAHHQDYVYEVAIHSLWGNLLAGFSALRMLTYFLLWLRPPTNSIMPSRPPTEALASFSLACGGFVFMLSSEEVSFVAMRNGFGDFMMILNVTVALVSLLFCWIAALMVLKAWAIRREQQHCRLSGSVQLQEGSDESRQITSDPQHYSSHGNQSSSLFVLEDEEEHRWNRDEQRQLSSSPEQA